MILRISTRLWPDLKKQSIQRQLMGSVEVLGALYALPLAITGLLWLVAATEIQVAD